MPEPPVYELPEFNGGIPGMPEVLEKPEYTGEIPNTPENSTTPNPGAPTPVSTTQPVTLPEVSNSVYNYPNGELPRTGTATDHLSILLGSGILLSLYVGKRKEEES